MNIRNLPNQDFTMVRNVALEDARLSWKAKGLLAYMRSRPERWHYNIAHLTQVSGDGRDSTRAGLRELEDAGYLAKLPNQDPKTGQIRGWDWIVSDDPAAVAAAVLRVSRGTVGAAHGEPPTNKTEGSKTEPSNTEQPRPARANPKPSPDEPIEQMPLPDRVPRDLWVDFVRGRRKGKHGPLTERGAKIVLGKLERAAEGDRAEMLEDAVMAGWGGVWPLKRGPNRNGKPKPAEDFSGKDYKPLTNAEWLGVDEHGYPTTRLSEGAKE